MLTRQKFVGVLTAGIFIDKDYAVRHPKVEPLWNCPKAIPMLWRPQRRACGLENK